MEQAAEALTIHPGDTLILRYTRLTAESAHIVKERLAGKLPGVDVLIVEAEQMAVVRAERPGA